MSVNYLEKRYNMDKKKLIVNSKENISQRRKDQMKMLLNQYEKIRRIYTEEDYIGSRTEALVSHECSRFLSSRFKKKDKGKSVIPHFLCKLWKR